MVHNLVPEHAIPRNTRRGGKEKGGGDGIRIHVHVPDACVAPRLNIPQYHDILPCSRMRILSAYILLEIQCFKTGEDSLFCVCKPPYIL